MSNKFLKIFLSIPSILGLLYMITFIYPKTIAWLHNNIIEYDYQAPIIRILLIIQIIYLIYKLWSYKNIEKSDKTTWTLFLVFFNIIASLVYIWKKDGEFQRMNSKLI